MISEKKKTREELVNILKELRSRGKKIGFTSGSFDIIHAGHAHYLEKAKEHCDVLVVGLNSDESVRKYKGPGRPIIGEKDRLSMVCALDSVDFAFLFDERRNKENIERLDPDLYIKAGDYKKDELTSTKYLRKDADIILIPPIPGISTTQITQKILGDKSKKLKSSPAVFLDRDGTINENVHFLHEPEKLKILPGVIEGLKRLMSMKYKLIIVTNQAGIGLGYFTKEDFFRVNSRLLKLLSKNGVIIDKIYYCPHSLSEKCDCRKPKTGLFKRAQKELNIDMKRSFTIGDQKPDIEAGKKAGTRTIMVENKYEKADFEADGFLDAVEWIRKVERE